MTQSWRRRPPRSFHVNKDGTLVCKHRDLTVCPSCAAGHREILDVHGAHFWMASEAERAELVAAMAEPVQP